MVLIGFGTQGNRVLNDPAAKSDGAVRRSSSRAIFELSGSPIRAALAEVMAPQP